MVTSLSQSVNNSKIGFSVFDQLSYLDSSLPFGDVLSADRVRDRFAEQGRRPTSAPLGLKAKKVIREKG